MKKNTGSFFRSFDTTKIYYEASGSFQNKKVIVFLHGLGGNVRAWDPYTTYFHNLGYTTVAFDLRGHGLSGRPRGKNAYLLENFAKDIQFFLQLHQLKEFILVGQCIGGMIALILTGKLGVKPQQLILIGTGFTLPSYLTLLERPKALTGIYYALNMLPLPDRKPQQADVLRFRGTGTINLHRFASDVFHTTARSYAGICSSLLTFNGKSLLAHITSPTLIIHGTDDIIFPKPSAIDLKQGIQGSQLVFIPGANHILVINNPQEILQIIEEYLYPKILYNITHESIRYYPGI